MTTTTNKEDITHKRRITALKALYDLDGEATIDEITNKTAKYEKFPTLSNASLPVVFNSLPPLVSIHKDGHRKEEQNVYQVDDYDSITVRIENDSLVQTILWNRG